jgi:DNA primase
MRADRLASRVGMPANKLKEFFAAGDPKRGAGRGPEPPLRQRGRMSVGRGNLLTQAIILVLHHPAAAGAIQDPELLGSIEKPGVSVLKELLEQAATAASPTTGMLLERWRDRAEYERLTELAMLDPLVADTASAAKELKMAVEKLLEEYGPGRRMDELLKKAEELGLNYDEKAELSSLLKSKGRSRAPS